MEEEERKIRQSGATDMDNGCVPVDDDSTLREPQRSSAATPVEEGGESKEQGTMNNE